MATKTGKYFDKAFRYMIKDHEEDIDLFKRAIDKVHDADVRTFASNTLPELQEHLDTFRMVQKIINLVIRRFKCTAIANDDLKLLPDIPSFGEAYLAILLSGSYLERVAYP